MIPQIEQSLVKLLSGSLADILPSPGQVGVCTPNEPGEVRLGLYLYAVRHCTEVVPPAISAKGRSVQALPPRLASLYYLLTAYSKADVPHRAQEEHRILERAMQVFEKNPVLTRSELGFEPGNWVDALQLQWLDIDNEEMSQIWTFRDVPYKLSVAYRVCPVELPGLDGRMVERVSGADVRSGQV